MFSRLWITTVAACAVLTLASAAPAAAISDGVILDPVPAWAAYITVVDNGGQESDQGRSCTGAVISDGWVLTAAHCVVVKKADGTLTETELPTTSLRVVLGRSDLRKTRQGVEFTVDDIDPAPDYVPAGTVAAGDLALLKLHGPLPDGTLPLPIAPSSWTLPEGSSPTGYGYGNTSERYKGTLLKSKKEARYLSETQGGSYKVQHSCDAADLVCLVRVGPSEIMHGDSGGPWLSGRRAYITAINALVTDATKDSKGNITGHSVVKVASVTTPSTHAWLGRTAGLPEVRVGSVYRDRSANSSWLGGTDGFLHPITEPAVSSCLTNNGADVITPNDFELAKLPIGDEQATCLPNPDGGNAGGNHSFDAPLPTGADPIAASRIYSLACAGSDTCVATGSYREVDGRDQRMLITRSIDGWESVKAPTPGCRPSSLVQWIAARQFLLRRFLLCRGRFLQFEHAYRLSDRYSANDSDSARQCLDSSTS